MSLERITRFIVPRDIATETTAHLRLAGEVGAERFVLWSGRPESDRFAIETMHVPRQSAYRTPSGLLVHVDGDELHRLNVWLFENGEQFAVQVHSHPTEAFHSEVDDEFPIVTVRGALSIVVPDFGAQGMQSEGVAVYRLFAEGWIEQSAESVAALLSYED